MHLNFSNIKVFLSFFKFMYVFKIGQLFQDEDSIKLEKKIILYWKSQMTN